MKRLRTLPTSRLLVLVLAVLAVSAGGATLAVAASGGSGPTPPPKPLAQALHDAAAAPAPAGITARIRFTNKLFPSGALLGSAGSSLMSGASGRLWVTADGHGRIELQSTAGDAQIVWSPTEVTVYDASSNTVYKATLPAPKSGSRPDAKGALPSVSQIGDFLTKAGAHVSVSDAQPTDVAGQAAYSVTVAPKHDGGLLGSLELAWDAGNGVPLRAAVYAQGASSPVLSIAVTDISYGPVPASDVDVSPPAGAKVVELDSSRAKQDPAGGPGAPVTGLAAVQAAAGFPVAAPDSLVGLPLKDVRLVGGKSVLVVYGQGLGAIVVLERQADAAAPKGGALASLPTVSLDGVTAHELATQLGTVIQWQSGGVDYVLAGSLPSAAAEAAARNLK